MGTPTSVENSFETLEDSLGFRSLLRFLVPALSGDLPDFSGYSRGFKTAWFRWTLPLRNHDGNIVVRMFGKRHLPGRKLEGGVI